MFFGGIETVWLYPLAVDFRKQMDGLIMLVADTLSLAPQSGDVFLFRNRQGNKLKLLWWNGNSFWLFYNRLEKGRYILPEGDTSAQRISRDELSVLLTGLDYRQKGYIKGVQAQHYF